jgi:hypothetical protein
MVPPPFLGYCRSAQLRGILDRALLKIQIHLPVRRYCYQYKSRAFPSARLFPKLSGDYFYFGR